MLEALLVEEGRASMWRDDNFEEMCDRLLDVFPDCAPEVVAEQNWGDYEHAREQFSIHGSVWDCKTLFTNRSVIGFVNDATYLFLLPRLVRCALSKDGLDGDVLDYVVFALRGKVSKFSLLFSQAQRETLIPPLQYLFARASEEWNIPEFYATEFPRILVALQAQPEAQARIQPHD